MHLSLDMSVLFGNASTIVNSLWSIVGVSAGFSLGFGILNMLLTAIAGAVHTTRH
jgi:hypothetical protein